MGAGLIIMDRDGVLNSMVINEDHGTIDSPLHVSQVQVYDWVPDCLKALNDLGYTLAIATNQPSAAKKKTTLQNLQDVHLAIVHAAQSKGAIISSSHICFHRSEDNCTCRKPKTGLLEQALNSNPNADPKHSWMVGDGVTDVEAGVKMGLKTAFFGPRKCDACKTMQDRSLSPFFWGDSLLSFVEFLRRT